MSKATTELAGLDSAIAEAVSKSVADAITKNGNVGKETEKGDAPAPAKDIVGMKQLALGKLSHYCVLGK